MRLPILQNDNNLIPWAQEMVRSLEVAIRNIQQKSQTRGDVFTLARYTVATLPSASLEGELIYVADESGGATLAFSDGTDWRRVQDRAIVS